MLQPRADWESPPGGKDRGLGEERVGVYDLVSRQLLKRNRRRLRLEHLNGDGVAAVLSATLGASVRFGFWLWLRFRLGVRRATEWV